VTRVLTILAAVAALAFSAAPVASAGPGVGSFSIDIGTSEKLKANGLRAKQRAIVYNGHAGLGANARANSDVAKGIVTDNKDPDKLGAVRTRGSSVIQGLNVKYT